MQHRSPQNAPQNAPQRTARTRIVCPTPLKYMLTLFAAMLIALALPALGASRSGSALQAQESTPQAEAPTDTDAQQAPTQVNVEPTAQDEEIEERLTRIMKATDWFVAPVVDVRDGVVFLDGSSYTRDQREWAGNLARNTQDVVAVVNRLELIPRPLWDLSPAWNELTMLWRDSIVALPLVFFGLLVLVLSWKLTSFIGDRLRRFFQPRLGSPLLAGIVARAIAIPFFLVGVYLVLQVAGLTRLALTVLGGTGVVGIVVGFAFRDIAENFLASLLLSIRQPFSRDDLISVTDQVGIVQQMNTRSTILMTLDGNHVQIPNALVYKSTITNFTANPNRRADFVLGIGYDDSTIQAQQVITRVMTEHPTVLKSPEPLVLVDQLAAATVNIRVYFWYDATQYAPIKIKSSLLRLIKRALQDANISLPDEAREVIFPQGVPIIQMPLPEQAATSSPPAVQPDAPKQEQPVEPEPVSAAGEGDLRANEEEIRSQADQSRTPEEGEDLLGKE